MKRNTRNSYVLMGAGAAAILLGGGVAFAFWTSSGTGSGTAAAGTTDSVDITQVGTAITGLYPGGPGQTISIDIANPNDGDVSIGDVTAAVLSTSDAGCTAADFAISGPVYGGGTISGGATQPASAATISMVNDALRNQDACKGVTVTLEFTAASS